MTPKAQRFPYVEVDASLGPASALPYVPITLAYGRREVSVSGLVDSGAALNVLPYGIGVHLGAVWDEQPTPARLTGNLAASDARAIILTATVARFAPVRLAFAWTRSDEVPVILGQVNFFMEFDVCLFRARSVFEIRSHESGEG